jgi:alcohol dehydrogenase class IV
MSVPRMRHVTPAFRTFSGTDALASLPREMDRLGVSRVMVFCGASMKRSGDALARVEGALGTRLAGRFDGVLAQSPLPAVETARQALEDAGADAVVAVGGGSAIVTARAASILLAERRDIRELCTSRTGDGRLSSPSLLAAKLPQWVVPSTPTTAYAKAGSAVRDPATGERLALFDPKTRAQGIFLDPSVALTAPPALTQSASLNAFAMTVEGLQSDVDDPLAEAQLTYALRMISDWLPKLRSDPGDPEPRLRLMLGALLCGQGSDYLSGGLAQALSHAAGPRSLVANGVIEALLLPYVMRYNAPVTACRLARVADALGRSPLAGDEPPDVRAVAAVERVLAEAGVPTRLRDVGIDRGALPEVAKHTMEDWALTQVPRPASRGELTDLLSTAW